MPRSTRKSIPAWRFSPSTCRRCCSHAPDPSTAMHAAAAAASHCLCQMGCGRRFGNPRHDTVSETRWAAPDDARLVLARFQIRSVFRDCSSSDLRSFQLLTQYCQALDASSFSRCLMESPSSRRSLPARDPPDTGADTTIRACSGSDAVSFRSVSVEKRIALRPAGLTIPAHRPTRCLSAAHGGARNRCIAATPLSGTRTRHGRPTASLRGDCRNRETPPAPVLLPALYPARMQRDAENHRLMLTHEFRKRRAVAGNGLAETSWPWAGSVIRLSILHTARGTQRVQNLRASEAPANASTVSLCIMLRRVLVTVLFAACLVSAAVPAPKDHFGFDPGEDYKLANYEEITGYFRKLAGSSDRIRSVEYGKTSMGRTSYIAFISSPENLKRLDEFKEMNRKLALGLASPAEAGSTPEDGAFDRVDRFRPARNRGRAGAAFAFTCVQDAHGRGRGSTPDSGERDPDAGSCHQSRRSRHGGRIGIRKNLGTPYELAPLPMLYQKYAGHDNNRDWFMMNLQETRNVARLLFQEWFPQIVYNQHQAPPSLPGSSCHPTPSR